MDWSWSKNDSTSRFVEMYRVRFIGNISAAEIKVKCLTEGIEAAV